MSEQSESNSGAERDRTAGLIRARDALSQLSYCPTCSIGRETPRQVAEIIPVDAILFERQAG